MRPLSYYRGRARLSGIWWLPLSLSTFGIGLLLALFASEHITPKSIFVSGYQRSDGTRVSSYYRRPPGSVPRDRPYERLYLLGVVLFGLGGFTGARSVYRFFVSSPFKLLPSVSDRDLPEIPRNISVPTHRAKARKAWYCEVCKVSITPGSEYWYHKSAYSGRRHVCASCKEVLRKRKEDLPNARLRYAEALRRIRQTQFLEYYGCRPEEIGIRTEYTTRRANKTLQPPSRAEW